MSVICCTFPITPQPMWSRVFLFPHFSVWLVDTDGSAYQRAFFTVDVNKKKKNHAQLGFKPSLGAAENSTGLTAQCNYWGRLENSM